jgi:glycosyltransferase involved in cell wall biosynthesis
VRIALLPDDYLPASTRIHAKMLHELAVELTQRGHEVVIITPGDWNQHGQVVVDFVDSIEVWRFKSKPTRNVGKIRRAINESLLSWRAVTAIKERLKSRPFDLCVNYSPTIFFGPLAWYLKRKGAYVYLVLRDFFPQWIIDEGMIGKHSPIAYYFRAFEHFNYRISDCVAVQSPANLALFQEKCPNHPNMQVLMNWADTVPYKVEHSTTSIREKISLSDKIVFFYGGNIGHAQDMANIMRLARSLNENHQVHFLLVGQGDEFELVQHLIEKWNLNNVTLLPSVSQDEYKKMLSEVDVGIFSLSSKHVAHNFPGKLLGYMVQSLPVLGSVNRGNDVIDVINSAGAGYVSVNGDDEAFLENALALISDPILRANMGRKANILLHEKFSVESAADEILSQVEFAQQDMLST